jgi:oligopeptide/dipeptide ABC transporter ATP-binding protein
MSEVVLEVEDLKTSFFLRRGVVKAVDGVSFFVRRSEVLGLVGESGCGKSITCRSIIRLVPHPGKIISGEILLNGENLLQKNEREMRGVRGSRISMVMQDPSSSLNPVFNIGNQISEAVRNIHRLKKPAVWDRVHELLRLLNFPAPEKRLRDYPHQLSGGMKQRVVGAIALSGPPVLLLADEPTTALDVTIQAQYINELKRLQEKFRLSIIFVTHDFSVVAQICDRVCVMYAGKVMEQAGVAELFDNPMHPYTVGLLNSLPKLETKVDALPTVPGEPPTLLDLPEGCSFLPRCSSSKSECADETPPIRRVSSDHEVRCWRFG